MMNGLTRLVFAAVVTVSFSAGAAAPEKKGPEVAGPLKQPKKPGDKTAQVGENVCGSDKEQSRKNETKSECSKDPCPPNPMQDCRRVAATCLNADGKGNYQAFGQWECTEAPKKDAPKNTAPSK